MQHDFFLSYRRTDQMLAQLLVTALEARDARVWWDAHIEGGEDWREAIVANLEISQALVILFSEACNSSRQLRKELAIADLLDKPLIPVLIEPATPKGHYLYELAARNWLQIHPNPESRIEELSDRLIAELGPAERFAPPAMALEQSSAVEAEPVPEPEAAISGGGMEAGAPPPRAAQPGARALARRKAARAPTRVRPAPAKPDVRRNLLAFKWYEVALALVLAILPIYGMLQSPPPGRAMTPDMLGLDYAMVTLLLLIIIAILVFPFRYFVRRLRARTALVYHLASVWLLSGAMGILSACHPDSIEDGDALGGNLVMYFVIWGVVTLAMSTVAFAIYGLLHFQRSRRELKANTEVVGAPA